MDDKSTIKYLEHGRANFAYECALDGGRIFNKVQLGTEWFKGDKYKTHIKGIPMMVKTNGLGPTFAYIKSKQQKIKQQKKKKNEMPGKKGNPKNEYDLIYKQTTQWLNNDEKNLLHINEKEDLVAKIILLDSTMYRAVTIEILAFFNWLIRLAEGLIKEETENA